MDIISNKCSKVKNRTEITARFFKVLNGVFGSGGRSAKLSGACLKVGFTEPVIKSFSIGQKRLDAGLIFLTVLIVTQQMG